MPEMKTMTQSERQAFSGLRNGMIGEAAGLLVVAGLDDNKEGRIEVYDGDGGVIWTLTVSRAMIWTASNIVLKTIHGIAGGR